MLLLFLKPNAVGVCVDVTKNETTSFVDRNESFCWFTKDLVIHLLIIGSQISEHRFSVDVLRLLIHTAYIYVSLICRILEGYVLYFKIREIFKYISSKRNKEEDYVCLSPIDTLL